jgi:Phage integrase family.|nr:MAG TPA: Integrase [Bacteriophage sp.]
MARRALQPGELGNITTTKVSKQGKAWTVSPDGTHWRASVLVGRRNSTPKRIRTIATSKRQAVKQCEEQAKQYIGDAKRASGVITPQSTPDDVWDAYVRSQRYQRLADSSRRAYESAVRDSHTLSPHWWQLPIDEAITTSALTQLYDAYTIAHGTGRAKSALKACLGVAFKLAADAINLAPLTVVTPSAVEPISASRGKLDPDRIFTPDELATLVRQLETYPTRRTLEQSCIDALILETHVGLRAGELFALTWDDFNLNNGILHSVMSKKTKRPYPTKPLPQWQVERLQRRQAESTTPRLFPHGITNMYLECRRIFTTLGYEEVSIHSIRKTVGSIIFDTYGARAASAWLAHANVQTTIAYYVKLGGALPETVIDIVPPRNTGKTGNIQANADQATVLNRAISTHAEGNA